MQDFGTAMIRLFAAAALPPPWQKALARSVARCVSHGGRPTREENIHLTVYFLGDTREEDLPAVQEALNLACAGLSPFTLTFSGVIPKAGRMLWAGFSGEPGWTLMCRAVAKALRPLAGGEPGRGQPAHATLARFKNGRAGEAVPGNVCVPGQAIPVTAVDLTRSQLTPSGPVYTRLSRHPLCAAALDSRPEAL